MQLRDAWIEKHITMVEDIAVAMPNGYVSKPEWRATIAEAGFQSRPNSRYHFPAGPDAYWKVHKMRETWAEEVMLYYTVGQDIQEEFDPALHAGAMQCHQEQRIDLRPNHRLPGPPDRLYSPVPHQGLTFFWFMHEPLADVRQKVVAGLLAQIDALAQVVAEDPALNAHEARKWLISRQKFGWPLMRKDDRIQMSEEQDHFERGVFAMMRGFAGEVEQFTHCDIPIRRRWELSKLETLCESRNFNYGSPYLLKGFGVW